MNNNQYTYQPPMGPMPSQWQPVQGPNEPRGRRARWARMITSQSGPLMRSLPSWIAEYSMVIYIIALVAVSFMYSAYSMPWYYMVSGIVSISVFFLYGSRVFNTTSLVKMPKERVFERRIFIVAFVVRLIFMLLIYWIFMSNYGNAFGFENSDARFYDDYGNFVADLIRNGDNQFFSHAAKYANDEISDTGYGIYVGFIYWLTGNSIIVVRLLKCLLSSLTVVLVYRLSRRNFGSQAARIAAIFCALWPNFWYYCGVHLKETEMLFLAVLFVEQADQMLRSRQFTAWKVIPILLIAASLFTFRTPLGLVALLAMGFSVVMSSTKVVSWGKRIVIGGLAVALVAITIGSELEEKAQELITAAQSGEQEKNMEWRSTRDDGGNSFAKYAGATVFAPMIFTLPFPTMVRPFDGQDELQLLNGGNFVKNIVSCFTIFAIILLLISGKWRDHMLPLSFMVGYLIVLVFSSFAQSERFHQPAMPFELMFAAYGLSIAVTKKKYKRWFGYWCGLMFVACIAWNWFKLAGRGLV